MIPTVPGSLDEKKLKMLAKLAKKYPKLMPKKEDVEEILAKTPMDKRIEVLSMLMTEKLVGLKTFITKEIDKDKLI